MISKTCLFITLLLGAGALRGDDFPQAEISNGMIHARLYLPDAAVGYYRGTRFDWSGQIPSLTFDGHEYFGAWNSRPYDPKLHDAIMGPVEEFGDADAPGYSEAPAGGTFVKIGVGVLRKPDDKPYNHFGTYEIVDPGKWTVSAKADSVVFTHAVKDPDSGYAYEYTKTVQLVAGKPELVLEHKLTNTGTKPFASDVYEHNFYMLDHKPTGPDLAVKFPFDVQAAREWKPGLVELRGHELRYVKELALADTAYNELTGYSGDPVDYDIRVENRKTGAGVRQTADRPMSKLMYWSIRPTACPEAYIHTEAAPGKSFTWRIVYDFYSIPAPK
jgi:hypothetical protein